MCVIWVTESSEFYSSYESDLIREQHNDAVIEEVGPEDVIRRISKETPEAVVLDNKLPYITREATTSCSVLNRDRSSLQWHVAIHVILESRLRIVITKN